MRKRSPNWWKRAGLLELRNLHRFAVFLLSELWLLLQFCRNGSWPARPSNPVAEVFKAAVAARWHWKFWDWAANLVGYRTLVGGFQDQLRWSSAFMRMLSDGAIVRQPFDSIIGAIAGSADGAILAPGAAIPVHKMNAEQSGPLGTQKAAGLVVLSMELLQAQTEAEGIITRSLRRSVGAAVDRAVFARRGCCRLQPH